MRVVPGIIFHDATVRGGGVHGGSVVGPQVGPASKEVTLLQAAAQGGAVHQWSRLSSQTEREPASTLGSGWATNGPATSRPSGSSRPEPSQGIARTAILTMLRRVQLKVLQWSDDKGVVGRVAENAVDIASQARAVAQESREAHGDSRPRCRGCGARRHTRCARCARARRRSGRGAAGDIKHGTGRFTIIESIHYEYQK